MGQCNSDQKEQDVPLNDHGWNFSTIHLLGVKKSNVKKFKVSQTAHIFLYIIFFTVNTTLWMQWLAIILYKSVLTPLCLLYCFILWISQYPRKPRYKAPDYIQYCTFPFTLYTYVNKLWKNICLNYFSTIY